MDSALSRRHVSTDSGKQLTGQQATRWAALFERVPDDQRPTWKEDPLLTLARAYYTEQGHLEMPARAKDRSADELALAAGLRHLREALLHDARDKHGFLVRRQLSDADIRMWEAAIPSACLWHHYWAHMLLACALYNPEP